MIYEVMNTFFPLWGISLSTIINRWDFHECYFFNSIKVFAILHCFGIPIPKSTRFFLFVVLVIELSCNFY